MWQKFRVVRHRYLSIVASGFAAVPLAGYGVAQWLGRPEAISFFDSWSGRILAIFFIAWWSAAFAHFRQILTLAPPAKVARRGRPVSCPKALVNSIAIIGAGYSPMW